MPKRIAFNAREIVVLASLASIAACAAPVGRNDEPVATTSAAGSTAFPNDKTAYDYFRAQGFTTFQAAGIVGNLDQESGVDPTISESGGGPGRGIAQWSTGGRWDTDQGDNLVAFAATEGLPTSSLQVQLEFIVFELDNFSDYGLAALQASTNVTDATTDFMNDFEECADCDVSARISYANDVLTAYGSDPVEVDGGADAGASAGDDAGKGDGGGASQGGGGSGSDDAGSTVAPPPSGGDDAGGTLASYDAGSASAPEDAGSSSSVSGATPASSGGGSGCAVATRPSTSGTTAAALLALGFAAGGIARRRTKRRARRA